MQTMLIAGNFTVLMMSEQIARLGPSSSSGVMGFVLSLVGLAAALSLLSTSNGSFKRKRRVTFARWPDIIEFSKKEYESDELRTMLLVVPGEGEEQDTDSDSEVV